MENLNKQEWLESRTTADLLDILKYGCRGNSPADVDVEDIYYLIQCNPLPIENGSVHDWGENLDLFGIIKYGIQKSKTYTPEDIYYLIQNNPL